MKILYKVPLIVAATIVFYLVTVFSLGVLYMQPSFQKLQRDAARQNMDRAIAAVSRESRSLARTARDWSQWDDTYEFAMTGSPSFVEENLIPPESWEGIGADLIAAYRMDGALLYQGRYEKEAGHVHPETLFPTEAPPGSPYLLEAGDVRDITGFINTQGGVYMIASTPILRSDASGKAAGSLIMGLRVDEELSAEIGEQISVQTSLAPFSGAALPAQAGPIGRGFDTIIMEAPLTHTLRGYHVIRDLWNNPVLVVSTETPAEISDWAGRTMRMSGGVLIAAGVLFCLFLYILLRRAVVKPVTGIRAFIDRLSAEESAAMPAAALRRRDELGGLAQAFLHMAESLSAKRVELRAANEALEEKIAARTKDLQATNEKLHLMAKVVETTSESVVVTDLEGTILSVNKSFCETSGYSEAELLGQNPRILKSGRHDASFYKLMWGKVLSEGWWAGEIWDRRKNGEVFPKWLTINLINDGNGKPMRYVGLSSDITHIKKTEERLHQLAYVDPLTSLPNRTLFRDRLERTLLRCQRYGTQAGLLFLDLDRFKYINDAMGHAVGDLVLVEAARRISSRVRKSDTVCRLGGDEFTIILEQVHKRDDMGEIAQGIIEVLSKPVTATGRHVFIGASIGIAVFPDDDRTVEGLTRKADAAMYQAKESGRNTFRFVSGKTDAASKARLAMEAELRQALDNGEFVLHYQPVVSIESRTVVGAEALVRWQRAGSRELVPPLQFISLAEDTGIIVKLGRWIMHEACRTAAAWKAAGHPVPVAVNVSARQFQERGFPREVRGALHDSGLPPSLLVVEVTESTAMADLETTQTAMTELKEIGIRVAIDDFGTGYSSLSYLSRFPVDRLKIDRSFVKGIGEDSRMDAIVDAIIAMAKSLGVGTIAEGVETEEQAAYLSSRGCREIQGFLFSTPLSAEEFQSFAARTEIPAPRAIRLTADRTV